MLGRIRLHIIHAVRTFVGPQVGLAAHRGSFVFADVVSTVRVGPATKPCWFFEKSRDPPRPRRKLGRQSDLPYEMQRVRPRDDVDLVICPLEPRLVARYHTPELHDSAPPPGIIAVEMRNRDEGA